MDYETLRALVNTNYLRVEMDMTDLSDTKEMLVSAKHNMDKETFEKSKTHKDEIMKYIHDVEKKENRILTLIHKINLLDERYKELPLNVEDILEYKGFDMNNPSDLSKVIKIADENRDKHYRFYFELRKSILEEYHPTPQEIAVARFYDKVTKMAFEYAKTFDDFWFCDIASKYREMALLPDNADVTAIENDFNEEIDKYCACKDYNLDFSHL